VLKCIPSFVHLRFVVIWPLVLRSVFAAHAACGLRVASWPCSPKNLPHRSRENEFTDGRVLAIKDMCPFEALVLGTPKDQLTRPAMARKRKGLSAETAARMEQEMVTLERDLKAIENIYGEKPNFHCN
jgi:hypothetical protein